MRVGSGAQRALQHFGMAAQLETRRSDPAGFLIGEYQAAAVQLEQFQEKCEAVFRPELRKNKRIERFCASVKS
ncbi:hypothetical protein HB770_03665 [Rhizobium leguminosarum bv. viciae]|uniref:Uncharacterized protein n=1 Tax=Rhizobium leguminosarum bv. viciae TaxID=387 RepID=A0A7G6RHR0_RHILV|nr:hypothetical protein HB770_03665 [Rhizobium leguminosarum bv. viciae]